jgi:hypothetical protein
MKRCIYTKQPVEEFDDTLYIYVHNGDRFILESISGTHDVCEISLTRDDIISMIEILKVHVGER